MLGTSFVDARCQSENPPGNEPPQHNRFMTQYSTVRNSLLLDIFLQASRVLFGSSGVNCNKTLLFNYRPDHEGRATAVQGIVSQAHWRGGPQSCSTSTFGRVISRCALNVDYTALDEHRSRSMSTCVRVF